MRILSMLRGLLLILVVFSFIFAGYAKEETVASSWVITPLDIDGSSDEWKDAAFHHEKKVNVSYAFRNDEKNLYIAFIFEDPSYLSTIKDTGMTIWINLEGKKKKHYGINFIKKQVPADTFLALIEQQRGPLSEEEKSNIRTNPHYFLHIVKRINKKVKISEEQFASEVEPAIFRSASQNNGVVYEFLIPLDRETEMSLGVGAEPGEAVKVGFEWGGLTEEMKARRAAQSQSSGDEPMRPAVSPATAMDRGTGASDIQWVGQQAKMYTFWVNVQLAQIR